MDGNKFPLFDYLCCAMTWSTNFVELTALDLHNNSSRSVLISSMLQIKVELKEQKVSKTTPLLRGRISVYTHVCLTLKLLFPLPCHAVSAFTFPQLVSMLFMSSWFQLRWKEE